MPAFPSTSDLLRELEAKNDRIRELEAALHNSTDLLALSLDTVENVYDRNYMRRQIDTNKRLLGIGNA